VDKTHKITGGKTFGDPMRALSRATESLGKTQSKLEKDSIYAGQVTTGKTPDAMGYGKQVSQKTPQPDRNAQFEQTDETAAAFLKAGGPVISVDTRKREKTGSFRNNGNEHRPKKRSRKARLAMTSPLRNRGKSPHTGFAA
jgi:hypothetical protein